MKPKKKDQIELLLDPGELELKEATDTQDIIDKANGALDSSNASDIAGVVLFRAKDGKFYVGGVEFVISEARKEYVAETLCDDRAMCQDCKHIEKIDDLDQPQDLAERVSGGERVPDGQCTKCGALSHRITPAEARVIAGITKPKNSRRGGLK